MDTPPLVRRAEALADALGFEESPPHEEGALLHVLAARRGIGRAAGIGGGAGVGAAWVVAALAPQVPFFVAERDPRRAAGVEELFADDPNVSVLVGQWRETLAAEAPFDLLVVDAADAKDDVAATTGFLAPGGTVVIGGFGRGPALPDTRRDAWLQHPLLTTAEIWVTPSRRALVAVRR